MPLYEFACAQCGARDEVFRKRVAEVVEPPPCPTAPDHEMRRVMSVFAHHLGFATKLSEAEATYGKEVDAAMGPEPDVGKAARDYERLAKDLPPESP